MIWSAYVGAGKNHASRFSEKTSSRVGRQSKKARRPLSHRSAHVFVLHFVSAHQDHCSGPSGGVVGLVRLGWRRRFEPGFGRRRVARRLPVRCDLLESVKWCDYHTRHPPPITHSADRARRFLVCLPAPLRPFFAGSKRSAAPPNVGCSGSPPNARCETGSVNRRG